MGTVDDGSRGGTPGVTDCQVSPRLDAVREGMAQVRRLSEHRDDEAISWGDAIVAAVVAAYNRDAADPASHELGGVATAVANLLGIHAGEQHTDEQIEARVLGHPAARAYFWLREQELERVNAGEVVEIGPFRVWATPLDELPKRDEEPPYPAELLETLALALSRAVGWVPSGAAGLETRRDAQEALDRFSAEVGRENVPEWVDAAIARLAE